MELAELQKQYDEFKARNLKLDMSRGKPSKKQLDLSMEMLDILTSKDEISDADGFDCRNYGLLDGIPEAKRLMADIMETVPDNVIVYGNASLNIMYDQISRSMIHGVCGSTPWCKLDKVKWLCVVPGYDRHFGITQSFGIENISVPMLPDGPDMDMVEELVSKDESIKGIWCVPKYSNPTGNSYSDEVVRRFARLKPAAKDFRIFWDNAYAVHHFYDDNQDRILDIINECRLAGNPDMVYEFTSTSKITFPGAGISAIAASKNNLEDIKSKLTFQTIGHDKINQLRHVKFLKDYKGVQNQMRRHAKCLREKFVLVTDMLEDELKDYNIASWTNPKGGYFVSFNAPKGCAKRIVSLCAEAGVKLTNAGATFPGGVDPDDSNIRIAPSLPPVEELKTATELLCLCTKIAACEKGLI